MTASLLQKQRTDPSRRSRQKVRALFYLLGWRCGSDNWIGLVLFSSFRNEITTVSDLTTHVQARPVSQTGLNSPAVRELTDDIGRNL